MSFKYSIGMLCSTALVALGLVQCKPASTMQQSGLRDIPDTEQGRNLRSVINSNCGQCHSGGDAEIEDWAAPTKAAQNCIAEAGVNPNNFAAANAQQARNALSCFLLPGTSLDNPDWSSATLGYLRAGVDAEYFGELFNKVFGGNAAEYAEFKDSMRMPPEGGGLNAEQFNASLATLLTLETGGGGGQASWDCVDDLKPWLKNHIIASKDKNWTNQWMRQPGAEFPSTIFGCPRLGRGAEYNALEDPLKCFADAPQIGVYHDERTDPSGRFEGLPQGWRAPSDQVNFGNPKLNFSYTIRILKEIKNPITYWMRSSADGRYVGNGRGAIEDLKRNIHINVPAQYDPGFSPDNTMFSYMGTRGEAGRGPLFCRLSFLDKSVDALDDQFPGDPCSASSARGTAEDYGEKRCENNEPYYAIKFGKFAAGDVDGVRYCVSKQMGTYQHQGVALERGAPYVIVRGRFAGNEGVAGEDPVNRFLGASDLEVYFLQRQDLGIADAPGDTAISITNEGDWILSPTSKLLAGRTAREQNGRPVHAGYNIRDLFPNGWDSAPDPNRVEPSRVCILGGKANISMEDRFITTHHFVSTDQEQRVHEEQLLEAVGERTEPPTIDKGGSSNVYMVDMLTGRRVRITLMPKGVYAMFPHFRADNWMYFLVRDTNTGKVFAAATDAAIHMANRWPTPDNPEDPVGEIPLPLHPEGGVEPPPPEGGEATDVFAVTDLGVSITDNSQFDQPMVVNLPANRVVKKLKVQIDIRHTYRGDLQVWLVNGEKAVLLHDRAGGSADNLQGDFDVEDFNGQPAGGTWSLRVKDNAGGDTGSLEAFRLAITHDGSGGGDVEPPPPQDQVAQYSDTLNLDIPDNSRTGVSHDFTVDGNGEIAGFDIMVEGEHTYHGDLIITLHKEGVEEPVVLHSRQGGDTRNNPTLTIDLQNIGTFNGQPVSGRWRLQAVDTARVDTGKITKIALKVKYRG